MKWIDLPPVWLGLFLVLVWWAPQFGFAAERNVAWRGLVGWALVALGLCLMILAVMQMARHRTTVIPHLQPSALVKTGIFGISRNPIYLGDALVLAGFVLIWDTSILFLLLVPAFMFLITRRFIMVEESRLNQAFGEEFATYCRSTRRWL
ncbi:MAG: isoprenylcysteine carboxylmethyltransferase family protein [Yoonia sp.]|uniref:methyltransferase family protein n=1 Tax=Yoonia sp. TaxID=2212373 RepID=UPI00326428D4